jgi:hypothetical protein
VPKIAYLYFIDYSKAFDSVPCLKMRNRIRKIEMPKHLTVLYRQHAAKEQVEQGTTKGVNAMYLISWSVEHTQQVPYFPAYKMHFFPRKM